MDTANNEIMALFTAAWLANDDSEEVPVAYPDLPFTKPDMGDYAKIFVNFGPKRRVSLGTTPNNHRRFGVVIVQLFTEQGDARQRAYNLAMIALGAFHEQTTAGGVRFRDSQYVPVGDSGNHFHANQVVEFDYIETQ